MHIEVMTLPEIEAELRGYAPSSAEAVAEGEERQALWARARLMYRLTRILIAVLGKSALRRHGKTVG
jgi:hypothetical protein